MDHTSWAKACVNSSVTHSHSVIHSHYASKLPSLGLKREPKICGDLTIFTDIILCFYAKKRK